MENNSIFSGFAENQETAEEKLSNIFNITSSNAQCNVSATNFFCKAAYRSCDSELIPETNECIQLQESCKDQWSQIQHVSPTLTCCNLYQPNFTCPDQFDKFCGICSPLCSEFSQYSKGITVAIDVIIGMATIVGILIFGGIVFVLAFFKRKTM